MRRRVMSLLIHISPMKECVVRLALAHSTFHLASTLPPLVIGPETSVAPMTLTNVQSIPLVTYPGGWGTLPSYDPLHTPGIHPFAAVVGLTFLAASLLVEDLEHCI